MSRRAPHSVLAALALVAGLLGGAPPAAAATTTVTFLPSQDTYVSSSNPNTNFNSTNSLLVGASPTRISYLQFTVTRLVDPVTSARLRLHVQNVTNAPSPAGGTAQKVGTDWSERTLTYATRPPSIGGPLGSLGTVRSNTWYELDVPGPSPATASSPSPCRPTTRTAPSTTAERSPICPRN